MKPLLALAILLTSTFGALAAPEGPAFFKKGDHLSIQYDISVQAGTPTDVTVQEFGPGSWVMVEYDRVFASPGESGMKKEKAQMWINFAHVITARPSK
jgi:hypothetical protein